MNSEHIQQPVIPLPAVPRWLPHLSPEQRSRMNRILSISIYGLASLIGVLAFTYPFIALSPDIPLSQQQLAHSADSPLVMAILVGLCLTALAIEAQGQTMSAKIIALLGILVAMNSALRFAETIIVGPGGFSPVFMLIIFSGYVFGARFGFLAGILTLLVSALITGGIGPWLPYQMFTAGWMGMSAGWLGSLMNRRHVLPAQENMRRNPSRRDLFVICAFGAIWGFLYGMIMNLWFYPFQAGDPAQSWQAGLSFELGVQRYLVFYLATSFIWDVFAALGNILLLGLFGIPTLKALHRFKKRFLFSTALTTDRI